MKREKQEFRWGVERRLEFIEFRLYWEGGINRSDLIEEFGVSVPQASKDLALYLGHASGNIEYDKRLKRYFASANFRPAFIELDAESYLERLKSDQSKVSVSGVKDGPGVCAEMLPIPQRKIRPEVLRSVLSRVRDGKGIEILYQSMNPTQAKPEWRSISPHAFGSDGLRWHVRAYCHADNKYKDFILSRCLDARPVDVSSLRSVEDTAWHTFFTVHLCPNPRLAAAQQSIIVEDFGMKNGEAMVPVRKAFLYYFSKRLRLDVAEISNEPRETPVVVKNRDEFDIALAEAMQ